MKKLSYATLRYISVVLLLLLSSVSKGQVQINSHVVPPYLNRIVDYTSRPELMVVSLTNTSQREVNVQLTAKITGDNGMSAWVKPGFRSPRPIVIAGGQTVTLNGNDIAFLFDINHIEYTGVSREDMVRGLGLKEGNYQLCIQALNYATLSPLSPPEPMGCTNIRIADLEPPRILTPFNDQMIDTRGVQSLVMTWTTPSSSSPTIQYSLKLVELPINRDPNDAMQVTTPLFEETVNTNMLLYGPAHPALVKGRRYAMLVQATDPSGKSNFRNQGKSEVISFVYGDARLKAPLITAPAHRSTYKGESKLTIEWEVDKDVSPNTEYLVNIYSEKKTSSAREANLPFYSTKVSGKQVLTYDFFSMPAMELGESYQVEVIANDPTKVQTYLNDGRSLKVDFVFDAKLKRDSTFIKGRLVYQFKDDPTGELYPIANEKVYVSKVYGLTNTDTLGIQRVDELSSDLSKYMKSEDVVDGVYVYTDKDGNFSLPLFLNEQDTSGIIAGENIEKHLIESGAGRYAAGKNYIKNLQGDLGLYYRVNVLNPHFKKNEAFVKLNAKAENNLQNIVLDANSYTLKVNVREVFNNLKGDYIEGAKIRIYRNLEDKVNATYKIPLFEGDIRNSQQYTSALQGNKVLIAERVTPKLTNKKDGNEAYVEFQSLFKNLNFDAYNYKIALVDGNTVLKESSFDNLAKNVLSLSSSENVKLNDVNISATGFTSSLAFNTNSTVANPSKVSGANAKSNLKTVQANSNAKSVNMASNTSNSATAIPPSNPNYVSKDRWQDYRYNDDVETAYLTLEKELITAPRTKIKGKLNYAYKNRNNLPKQAYANMPVKLMVFYEVVEQAKSSNQQANSGNANMMNLGYYTLSFNGLANAGYTQLNNYKQAQQGASVQIGDKYVEDNYKVLQTVLTDNEGNFEFDFPNTDDVGQFKKGMTHSGYGEFYSAQEGVLRRVFKLIPDIPFYCAPDESIIVNPWESQDIGTLTSFVKTHNVKVHVSKVDKEVNPTSESKFTSAVPINFYYDISPKDYAYLPKLPEFDVNQKVVINNALPQSGYNNTASNASSPTNTVNSQGNLFQYTANIGANFSGIQLQNGLLSQSGDIKLAVTYSHVLIRRGETQTSDGVVEFKDVVAPYSLRENGSSSSMSILLEADDTGRENQVAFHKDYFDSKSHGYVNRIISEDERAGIYIPEEYSLMFNKDFDPNKTMDVKFRLIPKPTTIRGRVTDNYTTLGLKGVSVKASIVFPQENDKYFNNLIHETTKTDDNGYFEFTYLSKAIKEYNPKGTYTNTNLSKSRIEILSAPGYEHATIELPVMEPGLSGKQLVYNLALKPQGTNVFGYVMDAETGEAVTARVKLKVNGTWVDTEGTLTKGLSTLSPTNYANSTFAVTNFNALLNSQSGASSNVSIGAASTLTTKINVGGIKTSTLKIGSAADANHPVIAAAGNSNAAISGQLKVENSFSNLNATDLQINNTAGLLTYPYQRFVMDLPARPDSIIIMPYDPAYLTMVAAVHPKVSNDNLGDFKLQRRKHLILVKVKTKDGKLVKNAKVYIEGAGDEYKMTNNNGEANFEFVNNSTGNFNIYVTNKVDPKVKTTDALKVNTSTNPLRIGNTMDIPFMPTSLNNFKSVDDLLVRTAEIVVDRAAMLTGTIKFKDTKQPVANAKVYLNQGSGQNSESEGFSNSNGEYVIYIPELAAGRLSVSQQLAVTASYAEEDKTFVGETKKINLSTSIKDQKMDFQISEVKGVDISKLFGFDVRLQQLREANDSYVISGEVVTLVDNNYFQTNSFGGNSGSLSFTNLTVGKSSILNKNGVPIATPVANQVDFVEKTIRISAFNKYNAQLSNFDQTIVMAKGESDSTGTIKGKVRLIDNSFNFPTSYLTIANTDFYLGQYATNSANKLELDVFKSHSKTLASRYSITKDKGQAIAFKYLGFDGFSEIQGARESYIRGDSINLFMNLKPKIQGGITLNLEAGKAVIFEDKILPIQGEGGIEFALDKWKVTAKSWTLAPNSGGIVLHNSKVLTNKADFSLKKLTIVPGELIFDEKEDFTQNLFVGGAANIPLHAMEKTEAKFVYDPDVGNIPGVGRFKLTIKNQNGTAAYLANLPGMTNTKDKILIGYISLLSNNEEIFGFSQDAKAITIQSQMSFTPQSFHSNENGLIMSGLMNLHLPKLNDNLDATIAYEGKDKKLYIAPMNFEFIGDGGTKFKSSTMDRGQMFSGRGFGVAGTVQLPGTDAILKSNLISMVTSSLEATGKKIISDAGDTAQEYAEQVVSAAAEEAKKQAEVVIGAYKEEAERFAANMLDEVSKNPTVGATRDFIEESLSQVNDTYNEVLKLGQDGKQYYDEVAAKMRLAGESMDAVKTMMDGNPIGGLLQLNGILKGATGVDIKDMAEQKTKQVAMQAIKAIQNELPVENIASGVSNGSKGFSGAKFDFDFKTGRMFGALSMPILTMGAVTLQNIEMEMLFEKPGWYFFAGAKVIAPVPIIFPLDIGMAVGSHDNLTPQMEAKFTSQAYVKKLPSNYKTNGFHGFFLTGKKDIIPEMSFGFNAAGIVELKVGYGAGFDARVYGNFGKVPEFGIGAMVFAHAYASLNALGVCSVSGSVDAEVGIKTAVKIADKNPTFTIKGCFSANITANVSCLFVDESFNIGILGNLAICAGQCNKGVEFTFAKSDGSASCSNDPDFDY